MSFVNGGSMKVESLPVYGSEAQRVVFLSLRLPSGARGPYHGHLVLTPAEARRVRDDLTEAIVVSDSVVDPELWQLDEEGWD